VLIFHSAHVFMRPTAGWRLKRPASTTTVWPK
jgi:hypothetical protein